MLRVQVFVLLLIVLPHAFVQAYLSVPDQLYVVLNTNEVNTLKSEAVRKLSPAKSFNFQNNNILAIEVDAFTNLTFLNRIILKNNRIGDIEPSTFHNLPELTSVDLDHNDLTYFEQVWFIRTPKLTHIDVSYNFIRIIQREAFDSIPSLQELIFQSNDVDQIHRDAFVGLPNLRKLDLSNNRIKTFHVNFGSIPLETLWVAGNNLTYIPEEVLQDIGNSIKEFKVYENPLQCSCHNKIIQWSYNKIDDPFKGRKCQDKNPICVSLSYKTDQMNCFEHIREDVARELDNIFQEMYDHLCKD